jgi:hypothetical protein
MTFGTYSGTVRTTYFGDLVAWRRESYTPPNEHVSKSPVPPEFCMRRFFQTCTNIKVMAVEAFGVVAFLLLLAAMLVFEWHNLTHFFK